MIQVMMKRIYNARMTAIRASNPWFKDYWNEVADKLESDMRSRYG
jgi:uncharacterized protein (DUF2236 family)